MYYNNSYVTILCSTIHDLEWRIILIITAEADGQSRSDRNARACDHIVYNILLLLTVRTIFSFPNVYTHRGCHGTISKIDFD